ncbi:hypothetical protein STEG23_013240, partial [Scotinomys teguina]
SEHLSTLIRESFFSQQMVIGTEIHNWSRYGEKVTVALNGASVSYSSPPKAQRSLQKRKWKGYKEPEVSSRQPENNLRCCLGVQVLMKMEKLKTHHKDSDFKNAVFPCYRYNGDLKSCPRYQV